MRTVTLDGLGGVMPVASNARNTQLYGFGAADDASLPEGMMVYDARAMRRNHIIIGVAGLVVGGALGATFMHMSMKRKRR
jgi:hypothetical protein